MAVSTAEVKQKLAQRQAQQAQVQENGQQPQARPEDTVRRLLEQLKPEIQRALPAHMSADRLARIALTEIRRNPKLLECDRTSLLGAIMLAAQLGLEPGPLGYCWLIPRYNSKLKRYEVQFMIGYRGYLRLLYNTPDVRSVWGEVVKEKDTFDLNYGDTPRLIHKPYMHGDRGKPIGAYIVVELANGSRFWRFLSVAEIERRRRRSASPDEGPWVTDWEAMALKTVVRDAIRWLPLAIEAQRAIAKDETVQAEIQPDMTEAIEVEYEVEPVDEPAAEPSPQAQPQPAQEQMAAAAAATSGQLFDSTPGR